MIPRIFGAAFLAASIAAAQSPPVFDWQAQSAAAGSYKRARQALDAADKAMGGAAGVRGIKDFRLRTAGQFWAIDQSPTPDGPLTVVQRTESAAVDVAGARLVDEVRSSTSDFTFHNRTVVNGKEGWTLDLWAKTATAVANPSLEGNRRVLRLLPQLVIAEALDRAATLRWVGEGDAEGRKQKIVSFAAADGLTLTLYLDAQESTLTKWEILLPDPLWGDGHQEVVHASYRQEGGYRVPAGRLVRVNGKPALQEEYREVAINAGFVESALAMPDGFAKLPAVTQPELGTVEKIAGDVYLLRGLGAGGANNSLVVAFDDHLLVMEAPEQRQFARSSDRALAKLKQAFPGKPVRYFVFTHHHLDHAGGLRAYVAEGATVVTTPGNAEFVRRIASSTFTFLPDALSRAPKTPVIEVLQGKKRVFRDANHVVEIYDVGPYTHAKEELIAYLPKEKILFEGDLFASGFGPAPPAQEATFLLGEKIRELGLQVDTILGVHAKPRKLAELRASIEEGRKRGKEETQPAR